MSVRRKVIVIITAFFICFIIGAYLISQTILSNIFVRMEQKHAFSTTQSVLKIFNAMLSNLSVKTADWSSWDDTYNFIEDKNEDYIKSNLVDGTFVGLNINLMLFIDTEGKIVFGKNFDLDKQKELPIPESLREHLKPEGLLLKHATLKSAYQGVLLLPEGPAIITSHPILTSKDKGPVRGTLIFGRFIDSREIKFISETSESSVFLRLLGGSQTPPQLRRIAQSFPGRDIVYTQRLNSKEIAGYILLRDIYQKPAFLLEARMGRDIYRAGRIAALSHMFSLIIICLGLILLVYLLMNKLIVSRLLYVHNKMDSIGKTGDISTRLSISGTDEISILCGSMNKTLENLQCTQDKLRQEKVRYELIIGQTGQLIYDYDLNTGKINWSGAIKEVTGFEADEFQEVDIIKWKEMIHSDDRESAVGLLEKAEKEGSRYHVEYRFIHKSRDYIDIEDNGVFLRNKEGKPYRMLGIMKDITERKQMEEIILKERNQARQFLDISGAIIVALSKNGEITLINKKGCQILGYKKGEIIGRNWFDMCIPEKIRSEVKAIFNKIMSGEAKIYEYYENPVLTKTQEERFIAFYNTIINDDSGTIIGTISSGEDITERKYAEEALKDSQAKYMDLFENANDMIFTFDITGNITSANHATHIYFGYPSEELKNKNICDLFTPESYSHTFAMLIKAITEKSDLVELQPWEFEGVSKFGSKMFLEVRTRLIWKKEQIVGVHGIARDITYRKEMEEHIRHINRTLMAIKDINQLITHERQPQVLLQKACDIIIDSGGYILAWFALKQEGTKELRVAAASGEAKDYLSSIRVTWDDSEYGWGPAGTAIKSGKPYVLRDLENPLFAPWKEKAQGCGIRACCSVPVSYGGKNYGAMNIYTVNPKLFDEEEMGLLHELAQDIGFSLNSIEEEKERKKADEEAERLEKQLLQAHKMEAIGRITSGVAHEINNPMSFISSNLATLDKYISSLNLLLAEYKKLEKAIGSKGTKEVVSIKRQIHQLRTRLDLDYILEDTPKLISESKEGADRIKKIVLDLRTLAKPQETELKCIPLAEIMDSTLSILSNELKYKAELIKQYEPSSSIVCYPQQLTQVFLNLLINAYEAIEERGKITIKIYEQGSYAYIEISDTGKGISEEDLQHIFEPFFTTKNGGLGLGLSISYGIIQKHKGTIEAKSKLGEGTTFIIKLPIEKE